MSVFTKQLLGIEKFVPTYQRMTDIISRCLSVSYNPARRECRLGRYDQTGSRIVYDADTDYYENLLGKFLSSLDFEGEPLL